MNDQNTELFYLQCDDWLTVALFDQERLRALAAESNLRRALRHKDGQDAALIAIGEFPCLVQSQLPRLWSDRQHVATIRERAKQALRERVGATAKSGWPSRSVDGDAVRRIGRVVSQEAP